MSIFWVAEVIEHFGVVIKSWLISINEALRDLHHDFIIGDYVIVEQIVYTSNDRPISLEILKVFSDLVVFLENKILYTFRIRSGKI